MIDQFTFELTPISKAHPSFATLRKRFDEKLEGLFQELEKIPEIWGSASTVKESREMLTREVVEPIGLCKLMIMIQRLRTGDDDDDDEFLNRLQAKINAAEDAYHKLRKAEKEAIHPERNLVHGNH